MPRLVPVVLLFAALSACFVDISVDDAGATSGGASASTSAATSSSSTAETTSTATSSSSTAETTSASSSSTAEATTDAATDTAATDTTAAEMCGDVMLAMTPDCVFGSELTSVDDGDALCAMSYGAGWRWLDHHIQGGWSASGTWLNEVGIGERGWLHVKDQESECFSSEGVDDGMGGLIFYGVTWIRTDDACHAGCSPGDGLEGPEFRPHPSGQCDSYKGDTPCSLCRRLVCAY